MSLAKIGVVVPRGGALEAIAAERVLPPFSPEALAFVGALSQDILKSPEFRAHPEAMSFAYWARTARLKQLQASFSALEHSGALAARGVAFHIAPSNVDTIFLYSLVISLLVGNVNIIRVSSRENVLMGALIGILGRLLDQPAHAALRARLAIVRYEHDAAISKALSDLCDLRIVWGGDATVNALRAIPLQPRAIDVCFADKVSLAVLDAAAYCAYEDKAGLARAFRNDSYWFGQMACSSPRAVIWRGSKADGEAASAEFWARLQAELVREAPELSAMDYLNKLLAEQSFMAQLGGHKAGPRGDNATTVVDVATLGGIPFDEHCGGGLFLQVIVDSLDALTPHLTRRNQTIISHGIGKDEWRDYLSTTQPRGIDRIVPFGAALDFNVVWDGYNLFRAFSREISLAVLD
ncbi:MAG: hypothetical protein LCH61_20740 [Proteobacteria bacterium]|nr:hypothetical protein [Pseudomonadota bacterium]